MFSSCYSKKYCIFVEKRLHLSNRSKLHCVRFALFFACEGRLFSESACNRTGGKKYETD